MNALCPGNVDTPMLEEVVRQIAAYEDADIGAVREGLSKVGAADRLVRPEEVAQACWMLCAPGASAVTGAALTVDCGQMVG